MGFERTKCELQSKKKIDLLLLLTPLVPRSVRYHNTNIRRKDIIISFSL